MFLLEKPRRKGPSDYLFMFLKEVYLIVNRFYNYHWILNISIAKPEVTQLKFLYPLLIS